MNDVDVSVLIVVVVFGAVLLKRFSEYLQMKLIIFKEDIITIFYSVGDNYFVHISLVFLLGVLASGIFYIVYSWRGKRRRVREERRERLEKEKRYVEEFLKSHLDLFDDIELKSKLRNLEEKNLLEKYPELENKIREAEKYLIRLKHLEKLREIRNEQEELGQEVRKLKLEKEELESKDKSKRVQIESRLNLSENPVFEKSKLTKTEIEVILEKGYLQTNEYCVCKREIITILIKPNLNHSVAHTFLVWSAKQLLEEYGVINKIKEHETRDADLTFDVEDKIFAIEIETGSLLRKKKQLDEKIKYLNRKYGKRWMIIVSNRNLVKKYKRFGLCVQRKQVLKKLEKMIQI